MKNSKLILFMLVMVLVISILTGCYTISDKLGSWVVVKQSDGVVTDVWKLENNYVRRYTSGGAYFDDNNGNEISVDGDIKVIKLKDKTELDKWHEFHMEIDGGWYEEPLASQNVMLTERIEELESMLEGQLKN